MTQKVALVTGGTKRFGLKVTLALLQRGYQVMASYHNGEGADATNRIYGVCKDAGLNQPPYFDVQQADLENSGSVEGLFKATRNTFRIPDLVVHCAGQLSRTVFARMSVEHWDQIMAVNVRSAFLLAREYNTDIRGSQLPLEDRMGSLVYIADTSALVPKYGYVAHSVAKASVVALTRALAVELSPFIRTNCLLLGNVLPPDNMMTTRREHLAEQNPMGQWGDPKQAVDLILALADGTFTNGAVWNYTGGEELVGSGW